MVTLDALAADPQVTAAPSALTDALEAIRDPQVRNRATIGGSVALVHQEPTCRQSRWHWVP